MAVQNSPGYRAARDRTRAEQDAKKLGISVSDLLAYETANPNVRNNRSGQGTSDSLVGGRSGSAVTERGRAAQDFAVVQGEARTARDLTPKIKPTDPVRRGSSAISVSEILAQPDVISGGAGRRTAAARKKRGVSDALGYGSQILGG